MKISEHAEHSEALTGIRGEDIHRWIDGFFDAQSFEDFLRSGRSPDYNPYNHRRYRHCAEALDDAIWAFRDSYSAEEVRAVFECHLQDDYGGYIPRQADFDNPAFEGKYHKAAERDELERILSEAELAEYFKGRGDPRDKRVRLSAGFYWRIVWPTVIAALLFAVSALTIVVPIFRQTMMKEKKLMIRELTATAASAIQFYIHQEQQGAMSRGEAQRLAAAEVAELRYGEENKDYFWVTDMHPRMVMHPYRPELVGADLRDYVDPEDKGGRRLFVELRALVEEANEGYLEYMWQWKDDPTHLEPKLSYVKGIPEWGWIIGTGIYIHDVEAEMARLSRNLLVADGVIAVALLAVLTNIVFQSRRMEMNRTRAEMGLREAKERYRALVESSNEGYVLVLDGEMVYSNHAMQRMTGYEAPELLGPRLLDLFAEESGRGVERLRRLLRGEVNRADFEAVLQTKSGATLEVYVSTARLFFSEKNGYVITFVPLARGAREALDAAYRMHAIPAAPVGSGAVTANLAQLIAESSSVGEVVQALRLLPVSVQSMTARGVRSDVLRKKVGGVYDAAVRRFIELSLTKMGEPPVVFAYLSLGSSARHDMTLFADQDSALVFADVPRERLNEVRRWFLRLADEVCGRLNQAGYPYCGGGIMAANPKWCLSMSEWRDHFRSWILEASPDSILEMNVFLDLRCGYGEKALVDALNEEVLTLTRQNPEFFIHYARNCLLYRAPLGLFGKLRTERQGNRRTINVKESLRPIEMFARIYALKYGIKEPGTLARLEALGRMEVLPKESVRELVYVLDYLWQLRFYNQIRANLELGSSAEDLDIEPFTEVERENLKTVLSRIALFQTRLSYEFLGVAQG